MESSKDNQNEFDDNDDNSIDSVKINFGVNVDKDNEHPTIPKNVNEFRVLDLYSADDVRQSIKSAMASKGLFTFGNQLPAPKIEEVLIEPISNKPKENNASTEDNKQNERVNIGGNNPKNQSSNLKRQGKPIKTGPSKRPPKRFKIDDFYIGKLSNFVPYKRKGESESDFDSESGVLY